jgi:hypothetical protein
VSVLAVVDETATTLEDGGCVAGVDRGRVGGSGVAHARWWGDTGIGSSAILEPPRGRDPLDI